MKERNGREIDDFPDDIVDMGPYERKDRKGNR
jgi:hypothetical protein